MTSGPFSRCIAALRSVILQTAIVALVTVVLLEVLVALSFAYPRLSPIPQPMLRTLHQHFDRNVIQVMPECASYDERVTYLLRPGTCTFANREFTNRFHINSLGVRDDESSLLAPSVVVLGDSVTMGWGVEQHEAYPEVVERLTGRRVLNAGISSFGTVRELRLLERIDRSRLEYLLIQYTDNDLPENEAFLAAGELRILTAPEYRQTVEQHQRSLRYIPGKYAFNVLVQLQSAARRRVEVTRVADATEGDWQRAARVFVDVLVRSPVDLSHTPLIVLSLHSEFIEALREVVQRSELPWIAEIRLLDAGSATRFPGAYYDLDDHPTAAGQEAIARAVVREFKLDRAR